MTQQEVNRLFNIFEPLLRQDPKDTHVDLIALYYNGIGYIKEKFADRSRELKAAAMYYLKKQYNKLGTKMNVPEIIIDEFFSLYDKEFENYKNEFELITDEDYLLLSFAHRKD